MSDDERIEFKINREEFLKCIEKWKKSRNITLSNLEQPKITELCEPQYKALLKVIKEVIDLLQVDGKNTKKQALKLLQEAYNNNEDIKLDELIDLNNLIERDKPKPLRYEADGYADGEPVYVGYCPNCDYFFDVENEPHFIFCPSCGQRLKWED